MAGDWIKMRSNLHDDPRVVTIAETIGVPELHAVGMLYRLWAWADSQSVDANALSVSEAFVDRLVFAPGFAAALRKVGWLEGRNLALTLPRFVEHNGQTAKARALTARRVAHHEARKTNGGSVSQPLVSPLPREEKRREESKDIAPVPKTTQSPFRWAAAPQLQEEVSFDDLETVKPKKPRERDECFEALAEIEGGHQALTITARGAVNKALKDIRSAEPNVVPDEIRRRGRMYRQHFPDAILSACALAKHWARCARYPEGKNPYKTAQGNATALSDALKEAERVINQA